MPKSTDEIIATIGASTLSDKLIERILEDQRYIAVVGGDVSAISWPDNLLGEMKALVSQRDYGKIIEHLDEWENWLDKSRDAERRLRETMVLIRGFVDFFQETNSRTGQND